MAFNTLTPQRRLGYICKMYLVKRHCKYVQSTTVWTFLRFLQGWAGEDCQRRPCKAGPTLQRFKRASACGNLVSITDWCGVQFKCLIVHFWWCPFFAFFTPKTAKKRTLRKLPKKFYQLRLGTRLPYASRRSTQWLLPTKPLVWRLSWIQLVSNMHLAWCLCVRPSCNVEFDLRWQDCTSTTSMWSRRSLLSWAIRVWPLKTARRWAQTPRWEIFSLWLQNLKNM